MVTPARKSRRKKQLTIAATLIVVLTFVFGHVITDDLKDSVSSIASAVNRYRGQMENGSITLQLSTIQNLLEKEDKNLSSFDLKAKDYSPVIAVDLANLSRRRSELGVDMDNVRRLVDAFPSGNVRELRNGCKVLGRYVADVDKSAEEMNKPSQEHDWTQAALVKLTVAKVYLAELYVVMFGDQVLRRAEEIENSRGKYLELFTWLSRVLYVGGIGLGLYAQLTGIGSVGSGE
jgi:hypothetical protein